MDKSFPLPESFPHLPLPHNMWKFCKICLAISSVAPAFTIAVIIRPVGIPLAIRSRDSGAAVPVDVETSRSTERLRERNIRGFKYYSLSVG